MSQFLNKARLETVTWTAPSAAYATDSVIFTAPFDCTVLDITEIHSVVGSDGGAVNIQVTKDTGTNAPGAGTDLLLNSSGAGFDLKATANTLQKGVLVTTAGVKNLAAGDRLSVDYAGTQTAVVGTSITVVIAFEVP